MIPVDLAGTTAVVTGASSGIGAAIARRLAEAGAHVVVHFRSDERGAREVAAAIDVTGSSTLVRADLGSDREVDAMFETVVAIGGCDVVVNNAGSYPTRPLLDMSTDDWSGVLRDNATTTFSCTRSAARAMIERGRGGSIINIASLSATHPAPEQSHYNSSKAAVVTLTMSAAQELGPHGIRVNAVSPGLIGRPDLEREWPDGVRRWRSRAPLGRLGRPLDVADACLFLASPLSSWITGQNLVVDGGVSAAPAY